MATKGKQTVPTVDIHGQPQPISEFSPYEIPKTRLQLIRDRVRRERRQEQPPRSDRVGASWKEVLEEDGGCSERGRVVLAAFLARDDAGAIATDPESGWPYGNFCQTCRILFALDPVQFPYVKDGKVRSQQTVKDKVVSTFARKLYTFRVKYATHQTWTYAGVKAEVERQLGEASKRVPHNNQYRRR